MTNKYITKYNQYPLPGMHLGLRIFSTIPEQGIWLQTRVDTLWKENSGNKELIHNAQEGP